MLSLEKAGVDFHPRNGSERSVGRSNFHYRRLVVPTLYELTSARLVGNDAREPLGTFHVNVLASASEVSVMVLPITLSGPRKSFRGRLFDREAWR